MSNTHQVIVYRNPLEAAVWDLFMNSTNTFPLIASVVVFFIVFMVLDSNFPGTQKIQKYRNNIMLALSVIAGFAMGWYLWV
jgi:zinc transporter ZupT